MKVLSKASLEQASNSLLELLARRRPVAFLGSGLACQKEELWSRFWQLKEVLEFLQEWCWPSLPTMLRAFR